MIIPILCKTDMQDKENFIPYFHTCTLRSISENPKIMILLILFVSECQHKFNTVRNSFLPQTYLRPVQNIKVPLLKLLSIDNITGLRRTYTNTFPKIRQMEKCHRHNVTSYNRSE